MNPFRTQRLLTTPPAAVFAAITDPQRLARWWGPDGFTNQFERCELRAGGRWEFDMIGPDGQRYRNVSSFEAIEADRQIVIRHVSAPMFRLTITLQAAPGGTLLQWVQQFDDPAVAQAVAHIVAPANEQNLDRLSAELQSSRS